MRIQELIIDGFKSYATRTVISNWDESFNCITGLNGSGKSNILDAICFVLGITTMSLVRASNQQDLIYKRGQAGVTKASVTIVFDNSDTARSPPGFADRAVLSVTRQIVMGGTSKYLLNGHRMQQTDIKKLFQSVQLNIDNPNFLIMQGKITKVLNMRPLEFLALVEEAAGTRMFETRRETALKTMAKKDRDIELNHTLLREEIEPKLNKLRNEKRDYVEYQRCQSVVERAERLVYAHDYVSLEQQISDADSYQLESERNRADLMARAAALDERAEIQARELEELANKRAAEGANNLLDRLEEQQQEAAQAVVKLSAAIEMSESGLQREHQRLAAAAEAEVKARQALEHHQAHAIKFTAAYEALERDYEAAKANVLHQQELLSSLETGISATGTREVGYASEARQAREEIATLQSRSRQLELERGELMRAANPTVLERAKAAVKELRAKRDNLRAKIEAQTASSNDVAALQQELQRLEQREVELAHKEANIERAIFQFKQRYPALNLENIPGAGTPAVLGFVAQMFRIREEHLNKAAALETVAGGKVFNVIVDTDITGQKILSSGLKRRTTVLPMNKLQVRDTPRSRVDAAKKLAPGQIELALDLVDFEKSVAQAVHFVFGSTLICETADGAKRVTYDPQVKVRTITWDGDVYDPHGTLSGGFQQDTHVLLAVRQFCQQEDELKLVRQELKSARSELASVRQKVDNLRNQQQQIELKRHELRIVSERLEAGAEMKQLKDAETAGTGVARIDKQLLEISTNLNKLKQRIADIERDASEFANNRSAKLDQLRKNLAHHRKQEHDLKKMLARDEAKYSELDARAESLAGDASAQLERAEAAKQAITELTQDLEKLSSERADHQKRQEEFSRALSEERQRIFAADAEMQALKLTHAATKKEAAEARRDAERVEAELVKFAERLAGFHKSLLNLQQTHPWLVNERHLLGEAGTPYDYFNVDLAQQRAVIETERKRLGTLNNKINPMVMSMIESVEKKEESLRQMIKQIEHDKRSIESTVVQIDNYKTEALQRTYMKVSNDLGQIFGELLPGSSAKLEPEPGRDLSEGLHVRVRLGTVWKDSLAELSGGQRSLVALSLILALLEFRPAPMYILDEVDAALDLHHTQNIGHIIKTKFSGAQFIVVSLKDGMFGNANRIFQTRFQEGTSNVTVMA